MTEINTMIAVLGVVVLGCITTIATGQEDMLSQNSRGELSENHHRYKRQAPPMPFPRGFPPFPPHMGDIGGPNGFRGNFGRRPFSSPFPGRMPRQGFPTGGNRQQGSRFFPRQSGGFRNMRRPNQNAAAPGPAPAPTMMPTPRRTTQRMQTPNMRRNSMRIGQTMQQTKTPSMSNMESAQQIKTASMDNLRNQENNARVSKETNRLQNTTTLSNSGQAPLRDQTSPRDQTSRRDQTFPRDQVSQWDQALPGDQTFRRDQTNSPRDQATFNNQATRIQGPQRDQLLTLRQQSFPSDQGSRLDQGSNQASLRNQASQRDQATVREQAFPSDQGSRLGQGSSRNQAPVRNQASQRDQTTLREQSFPNDQGPRRIQASRNQALRIQVPQREQQTNKQEFSNDRGFRGNQALPRDQNTIREATSPRNHADRRDQISPRNYASKRDQADVRNQDAGNTNFSPTPEPDILAAEASSKLGGAKVLEISFIPSGRQAMSMQPSWVVSRQDGTVDRQGGNNLDTLDQLYLNEPQSVGFGRTGPIGNAAELSSNLQNTMADSRSAGQDFQQQGQQILGMMDAPGSSMIGGQGEMRNNRDRFGPSLDTLDRNGNLGGSTVQDFQQNMMTLTDATSSAMNDGRGQMRDKLDRFSSMTTLDGPLTRNMDGSPAQEFQQQGNDLVGIMDGQRMSNLDGFSNSFDTADRRLTGNMAGSPAQDFQQLGQNIKGMMDATGSSMFGGRRQMRKNIDGFASSINTIDKNQAGNMGDSKNYQQQGNDLMSMMDAAESSLISSQGQMRNGIDGFSNSFSTNDGGMRGNIGGSTGQDFPQLGQNVIGVVDSTGSFIIRDQGHAMNNMDGFANSLNNIDGSMSMSRDVGRSFAQDSHQSSQDTIGMMDPSGSTVSGGRGNRLGGFTTSFDTLDGRMDVLRSRMNNLNQADLDMMGITVEQVPLVSAPAEMGVSSSVGNNNDMSSPVFEGNSQTHSSMDINRSTSRNGRRLSSTNGNVFSPTASPVMDRNGQSFMDNHGLSEPVGSIMMDGGYLGMQDTVGLSGLNRDVMDFNRDSPMSRWADSPSGINRNANNAERSSAEVDANRSGQSMMDMNVESFMNARGYTDVTGPIMMDGGPMTRLNGENGSNNDFLSTPLDGNVNRNGNDRLAADGAGPPPSQMDANQHQLSVMNGLSFGNSHFTNTDAPGPYMVEGGNRGAPDFIGATV